MTYSVSLVYWSLFLPACGTLVDSLRAFWPLFHACENFADSFSLCVQFDSIRCICAVVSHCVCLILVKSESLLAF